MGGRPCFTICEIVVDLVDVVVVVGLLVVVVVIVIKSALLTQPRYFFRSQWLCFLFSLSIVD